MVTTKTETLNLSDLNAGLLGITGNYGGALAEAAAVCLESQSHATGVKLNVSGEFIGIYEVYWDQVDDQMRKCYADEQVATEHGAYGIAFLIIRDKTDFTVMEKSKKGTGFDYWLGTGDNESDLPFQNKERLEVSGIRKGNDAGIKARVNKKLKQVEPSDNTGKRALIVVVEFSIPKTMTARK